MKRHPLQTSGGVIKVVIVDQNGDHWFVLRDLLDAMDSSTTTTAATESIKQWLGDGFVADIPILDSLGRRQTATAVAESGATFLLSRSNTEHGRALNRHVHVDVLPSIRKTGSYQMPKQPAPKKPTVTQVSRDFEALLKLGKRLGLDDNVAAVSANQAVTKLTGINLLEAMNLTHLDNPEQERYFTPTELGREIGVSGQGFNKMLQAIGLQKKVGDKWVATEVGEDMSRIYDTGKRHNSVTMVPQVKWSQAAKDTVVESCRLSLEDLDDRQQAASTVADSV